MPLGCSSLMKTPKQLVKSSSNFKNIQRDVYKNFKIEKKVGIEIKK